MSNGNGRLPTEEEMRRYNGYDGGLGTLITHPQIVVGPADKYGRRLIVTQAGDRQHRDRRDCDNSFERQKWREAAIGRLGLADTGELHEWLESELTRKADAQDAADEQQESPPRKYSIAELIAENPHLHEPIINGLLRRREVGNVISVTKVGKSWFIYYLALGIIVGRLLFGRFQATPGRVLLIDNELHGATLSHRIPHVAAAMGLELADYRDGLEVLPLRGKQYDLKRILGHIEETIEPGEFDVVLLDAWYRSLPSDVPENGNQEVMQLYNWIDHTAEVLNVGWLNVHHSSKGSQSEKSVVDVGSGAGSQSRAPDCHLILRPHEETGAVVLEAAVRSFAPVEPLPLRWSFPLWRPAEDLDPTLLKGRKARQEQKKQEEDTEGVKRIIEALLDGPQTLRKLRPATGMGKDRCERLLASLKRQKKITANTITIRGNECEEYTLVPDVD